MLDLCCLRQTMGSLRDLTKAEWAALFLIYRDSSRELGLERTWINVHRIEMHIVRGDSHYWQIAVGCGKTRHGIGRVLISTRR